MVLGKDAEVNFMSEGKQVDWRELWNVHADKVVEIELMMRGDGRKKKTGNPWERLASGGEREETEQPRWTDCEEILKQAKEDGGTNA